MYKLIPQKSLQLGLSTALVVAGLGVSTAMAQQASITLTNSDAQYCYTHDNAWTITKEVTGNEVVNGAGTVTWTVTATKDSSAAPTFSVHGGLTVINTGTAPATIGNIVVNLQRPNSPKQGSNASHVSIAANVADATNGDGATSAKIVAAASAENVATNAAWGTNNYTVSGAVGTFTETSCSGTLNFTDASNNSIFALVPQPTIPVGGSITLLYDATFNAACLPVAGTTLRVEALVSFGNAGLRGGSGAVASNVDINGNSIVDTDEARVRTVPARNTMAALPAAPEETNNSVSLVDTVSATGTVTTSNLVNNVPATTDTSGSWTVSVDVNAGTDGGQVCNTVTLDGTAVGGTLSVIIGYDLTKPIYDPLDPTIIIGYEPIYATYECVAAADEEASACVDVDAIRPGVVDGDFCTYTLGGYGAPGNGTPDQLILNNFTTVFNSGLTIGIDDGAGPQHHATWTGDAAGLTAIRTYLTGGGGPGALTADTVNATSVSGGALAKQTTTLTLNVGFDAAGVSGGSDPSDFGDLTLCNTGTSLDGQTVSQILGTANTALGTASLPSGYTFGTLNTLIDNLNNSFDNCQVSAFATSNLCR